MKPSRILTALAMGVAVTVAAQGHDEASGAATAAPQPSTAQTAPPTPQAAPVAPARMVPPRAPESDRKNAANVDMLIRVSDNQGLTRDVKMVVTHGERGSVRQGADVPIVTGEKNVQYKSVGLNVDARPWVQDDGRVRVSIVLDGTMVGKADPERPVFYSIRQSLDLILRDGQTIEASRSSDPSGDRTFSISVTAKIVR